MHDNRIDAVLSDLFFNHTHEHYDALNFKECTRDDMEEAIKIDAREFLDAYGSVIKVSYGSAQELANDFMVRL